MFSYNVIMIFEVFFALELYYVKNLDYNGIAIKKHGIILLKYPYMLKK